MRLHFSTTSPYVRIVRVALAEKGCADIDGHLTDPWQDHPDLLEANPSARVPALVLDNGLALTESLLIVLWLETQHAGPTLLGNDPSRVISKAGVAMGVIDAAAAIIIGRKMSDAGFDESPVGVRRRRSVIQGFQRLEADPPAYPNGTADLAVITAVIALDYVRFRFPGAPWLPQLPRLDALAARAHGRPSLSSTMPRDMPQA
jgi:glutathione S-transferase